MASCVEGQAGAGLQEGDTSRSHGTSLQAKPVLGPKPLLTAKPFSLQRNTTIRSIHAPKTVLTSSPASKNTFPNAVGAVPATELQSGSNSDVKPSETISEGKTEDKCTSPPIVTSDSSSVLKATSTVPKTQPSKDSPENVPIEDLLTTTKENNITDANNSTDPSSAAAISVPASQPTEPKTSQGDQLNRKDSTRPEALQKCDVTPRSCKASTGILGREDEAQPAPCPETQDSPSQPPVSASPEPRFRGTRSRLSMKLTSVFETNGQSPPSQSTRSSRSRESGKVPTSIHSEKGNSNVIPSSGDIEAGQLKEEVEEEDRTGGSSIKRRISMLFDSSSRQEVSAKMEEPHLIGQSNGAGGIKERIKNWALDAHSGSDNIPHPPTSDHTKSYESVEPASPTIDLSEVENTSSKPLVKLPATETPSEQAVDPHTEILSAAKIIEHPLETSQSMSTDEKPLECSTDKLSINQLPDPGSNQEPPVKARKNKTRRRAVRFGTIDRDDGAPPVPLGSDTDSSPEVEEGTADKAMNQGVRAEKERGCGQTEEEIIRQETEREEQLREEKRLLEEEKRREEKRLLEEEKCREEKRLLEEEQKQERERLEEKERERARQLEVVRQREEERECARQEEERLREEERAIGRQREVERLKEEERERQRLEERLKEEEKERQRVEERLREEEREIERQREVERLKEEREIERQREVERLKEEEREIERQREVERLKEEEREIERQREVERLKEEERERQRLEERLKEEEKERQRVEERLREEEKEIERQREVERLKEEERKRQRLEERLNKEEKERQRVEERLREEEERERQRLEERLKEEEKERQRVEERLREEERVRQRVEERLKEEERERHRLEERLREEERDRQKIEEILRERELEREQQNEQQRRREEEERERQKQEAFERKRAEELEVKLRETERRKDEEERERERLGDCEVEKQQEDEREKEREEGEKEGEEERLSNSEQAGRDVERAEEKENDSLISLDSESVDWKSDLPPTPHSMESGTQHLHVPYDDFSVKMPGVGITYEDFSVKPLRWGSKSKVQTPVQTPVLTRVDHSGVEEVGVLVALDDDSKTPQGTELNQAKGTDCFTLSPTQENPESPDETLKDEEKKEVAEQEEEEVVDGENEVTMEEGDHKAKEQLESLSPDGGVLDTEALLEREPEHQHEACKHTPEAESPKSVPDLEPGVTSDDLQVDTESELPSFPESSARLLDNHAQRSRAELIKRRSQRTRLPRTRQSSMLLHTETSDPDWRACDSTEETERINPKGTDSEEEEPAGLKEVSSPPPAAQQVPVIPRLALSNSALLAHLKKKTRGGGEETVEDKDGPSEEPSPTPTPTPTQLSRSPRSPALLPGAARVLPPIGGKDEGTGSSPSWLKELRTKKRLSQHDGGT